MIIIEDVSVSGLHKREWRFYILDDTKLTLAYYFEYSRETRRHGFVRDKMYARNDGRQNTINKEDVPFPTEIIQKAKEKFISMITVTK